MIINWTMQAEMTAKISIMNLTCWCQSMQKRMSHLQSIVNIVSISSFSLLHQNREKCSAVTWPSKPSFSNVSEDWITYSPQTDSGLESTKNRNPFSPHCVQGDSLNQKFLHSTKPTTYDFPQADFQRPTPHKEARCLTATRKSDPQVSWHQRGRRQLTRLERHLAACPTIRSWKEPHLVKAETRLTHCPL